MKLIVIAAALLVAMVAHGQKSKPTIDQKLEETTKLEAVTVGPNKELVGHRLVKIEKGSFYEKIGLKEKDIIKKMNGKPVQNTVELMDIIFLHSQGTKLDLLIEREGKEQTVHLNAK